MSIDEQVSGGQGDAVEFVRRLISDGMKNAFSNEQIENILEEENRRYPDSPVDRYLSGEHRAFLSQQPY